MNVFSLVYSGLWIGWPGTYLNEEDKIPESDSDDTSPTAGLKSSQIMPINLEDEEHELYYNGCCNGTFWPLFHSMPDRTIFEEKYWTAYRKVLNLERIFLKFLVMIQ